MNLGIRYAVAEGSAKIRNVDSDGRLLEKPHRKVSGRQGWTTGSPERRPACASDARHHPDGGAGTVSP